MQIARNATLLVALAASSVSMLIDTVVAVEVSESATPLLSTAERSIVPQTEPFPEATPPSPDCFILGARAFTIPFTVDAGGTQPIEVHLFVSRGDSSGVPDQWNLLARKRPDVAVKEFQFTAPEDGEFWFATRTIDAHGNPHPSGAIQSQLKVFVDTTKPLVNFNADADASGRVDATLRINDATPLKNLQLRYVTDNVNQWQKVDIDRLPPDGVLHFTPADEWTQLSLQLVATDTPGNQCVVSQLLRRPRLADAMASRYAAAPIGGSIDAVPIPYRIETSQVGAQPGVDAQTVAGPVIKLDRHNRPPVQNHAVAGGFNQNPTGAVSSAFGGFRGVGRPRQRATAVAQSPAATHAIGPGLATRQLNGQPRVPQSKVAQSPIPQQGVAPLPQRLTPTPPNSAVDLNRLFQTPAKSRRPGAVSAPRGFGPPSIYGGLPPAQRLTQNVLPPPATPEEISNGFGLNSPAQTRASSADSKMTETAEKADRPPTRARTAAEAMRPLSEQSAVPVSKAPEQISAPKAQPDPQADRYKAKRLTPTDSGIAMVRAPVRYSDSERFSLAYELEAVGSYGVEAIELYGSLDGGRSWKLWGKDPDRVSPFDIETKEQGVFGFRIVVVGRNGLASPRPQAGESPDIMVVVDKVQPTVRITGAQYGEGDRIGSLVINYEVADANLTKRPIALSFSDDRQGPWTTIAAGLRNDGDYVWPADPELPRKLFLRIDATDQAGNVGTYVLDQPIDVQGLAPRARIRGFQSLTGNEPPPTDSQTAKRPAAAFK